MKIAVSCESTVDMPRETLNGYNVFSIPFHVILGEESFFDGDVKASDVISYVDKTGVLPKTSAVNVFEFEEYFEKIKKEYDAIIHISLSSEISSAYQNAVMASKKFDNVFVVDSRSLSTGIGLLVLYAVSLVKTEQDPKKVFELIKRRVPYVQASFVLNRLDYLYKGGRCSAMKYFGANLLKLRPQILLKDGKMESGNTYRGGFRTVARHYVDDTLRTFSNPDYSTVFVTYTTITEEVLSDVVSRLKEEGFQNILTTEAHATVTSHSGEECFGILYFNDGK